MRTTTLLIAGAISSAVAITAAFAQSESNDGAEAATTKTCYPAKYTESGDLILPENFHEWVYVGSPLTPNALTGGQRSEERRVGKAGCSTCRTRWSPSH